MRFVRYRVAEGEEWGLLDELGRVEPVFGDPIAGFTRSGSILDASGLEWLPPATPSKVVAIALNYVDHAAESCKPIPGEPVMFLKPPSALLGSGGTITLPHGEHRVDHEAELAVVIRRRSRNLRRRDCQDAVLGYTCANDVSDRTLQRRDGQFTRGKGFDSFCPLGRELVIGLDPSDLLIECRVNGELRQQARTSQMVFDVESILTLVSSVMTLEPWDVVLTGTPSGVSQLFDGDVVEVEVQGLGCLSNNVHVSR